LRGIGFFFDADAQLKIRFFQKACPELERDRIFFDADAQLKIRFFQKACPELERDRIFLTPMLIFDLSFLKYNPCSYLGFRLKY
jgi:hypothetical protein